ncbi:MAG TPA: helix-turn-helix domain-containing protein [Candidatus Binatia bacterium]|jgi:transcriptional regulator GlxA family with amidase domain|nr:helix-turn-helix domain-containing protein [Candidatus Binatia bacterium]
MPASHLVAIVAFDGISVFEMAVGCEVFGVDRSDMGLPNYELRVCGADPGALRTKAGFLMEPVHDLRALEEARTVIVPAWRNVHEDPPAHLTEAIAAAHTRGARIASFCSGAFVLAAAGLLDGRRATTHWMYAQDFARRFPDVVLDPSVLYVDSGHGIYTSAGTAAAVDLCLHLVRLDHGAHVANMFARRMVVPAHRDGGQAQYVEAPVPVSRDDRLAGTLDWALANLEQALTVEKLAAHASMSPRTFARRFLAATGSTPLRWLVLQRVARTQRLLETTDLSIEQIAARCGFGSPATLRAHFGQQVGTSPSGYRIAFQGELAEAG